MERGDAGKIGPAAVVRAERKRLFGGAYESASFCLVANCGESWRAVERGSRWLSEVWRFRKNGGATGELF